MTKSFALVCLIPPLLVIFYSAANILNALFNGFALRDCFGDVRECHDEAALFGWGKFCGITVGGHIVLDSTTKRWLLTQVLALDTELFQQAIESAGLQLVFLVSHDG